MHPNPAFRGESPPRARAFARDRGFGTLAVNDKSGPLLAHVPFLLSEDGHTADLHLVRSNPILATLETPQPAVIAVSGPDGYVSPDWYGDPGLVPTWNYVAVHLRGRLERRSDGEIRDLLARQSAAFEVRLTPKPTWTLDKLDPQAEARLLRMIVPVRLQIETIDSTWKLGQNREEAQRLGAAAEIETGFGQELAALARLMRGGSPEGGE